MDLHDYVDSKKITLQCENVDIFELFLMFDSNKNAFIDVEDIDLFLRRRNIFLFEEEIMTLLLKYDFDNDNRLNFDEFVRFILPSPLTQNFDKKLIFQAKNKYKSNYYTQLKRIEDELPFTDQSKSQFKSAIKVSHKSDKNEDKSYDYL